MGQGVAVVVQARMGSSRLPGKVLADLAGRPMLRLQLDRLQGLEVDQVVVATSSLSTDDPIVDLVQGTGAEVVRGPEMDVLARFGLVLARFEPETIVRLTGDCPLTDPHIVMDAIALHDRTGAHYTSNVHPRSFPKGLDVEVASGDALATAVAEAVDAYDREHVTPFLYHHPERFTIANLESGEDLGDLGWTVDTTADLERIRQMVGLLEDPATAAWTDILAAVRRAGLVS